MNVPDSKRMCQLHRAPVCRRNSPVMRPTGDNRSFQVTQSACVRTDQGVWSESSAQASVLLLTGFCPGAFTTSRPLEHERKRLQQRRDDHP